MTLEPCTVALKSLSTGLKAYPPISLCRGLDNLSRIGAGLGQVVPLHILSSMRALVITG